MITSVYGLNFKGSKEINVSLAPVTWLYGNNFAGKTSVVQAMALALCGQIPYLKSGQPSDIHRLLASGDDMHVDVCSVGSRIARHYVKMGKQVKYSCKSTGYSDDYAADIKQFWPQSFMELSGPARIRHLFNLLPAPPLDKVGPELIVTNLKNFKADPHTKSHEKAIDGACDYIRADFKLEVDDHKMELQDWLQSIASAVGEKAKAIAQVVKRMGATAVGVTELRGTALPLAQAEQLKQQAQAAYDAANKAITEATEQYKGKDKLCKAAKAAATATWLDTVRAIELEAGIIAGSKVSLLRAKKGIDATEFEFNPDKVNMSELPVWVGPSLGVLTANVSKASAALAAVAAPDVNAVAVVTKEIKDTQTAIGEAKAELGSIIGHSTSLMTAIKEITDCASCPYCKSKKQGWKDLLLEEKNEALAVLKTKAQQRTENITKLETALTTQQERLAKYGAIREHRATLQANLATANTELQQAQTIVESNKHIFDAKLAWDKLTVAKAAEAATLEDELETLAAKGKELRATQEAAATKKTDAETAHATSIAEASAKSTAAKATEKMDNDKAELEVWKFLAAMLQSLSVKCVEEAIKPLIELCNNLCAGILKYPLAYVDEELGMQRDGKFVPWVNNVTFSGTESALASAALGIGLAAKGELKIAIVDEMGRLDSKNRAALIKNLLALVENGSINQAIMIDVNHPLIAPKNEMFKVIEIV